MITGAIPWMNEQTGRLDLRAGSDSRRDMRVRIPDMLDPRNTYEADAHTSTVPRNTLGVQRVRRGLYLSEAPGARSVGFHLTRPRQ